MPKKLKFLKDHMRHRKGEVASILDESANYFIKCGVAVEVKPEGAKQTKESKSKQTK